MLVLRLILNSLTHLLLRSMAGRVEIPLTSEQSIDRHKYLTSLITREKIIEAKNCVKNAKNLYIE